MHFGMPLPQHGPHASPRAIADLAVEAERRGYSTL